MAIQWGKKRDYKPTSDSILDRIIDGKVVDIGEWHDRQMLTQQLGIILSVSRKQSTKRVR
jgi:hypothetical protein